jgi:hypothetical protein
MESVRQFFENFLESYEEIDESVPDLHRIKRPY